MYRVIGALLVFTGSCLVGWQAGNELTEGLRQIRRLTDGIKCMEREISRCLLPLPELLACVGGQTDGPLGRFFLRCGEYAAVGDGLFLAHWEEAAATLEAHLDACSMDCLLRLGRGIGRYHWEDTRQLLSCLHGELETHLRQVEKERAEKGQVYQTLGATAGAFLVILLL